MLAAVEQFAVSVALQVQRPEVHVVLPMQVPPHTPQLNVSVCLFTQVPGDELPLEPQQVKTPPQFA